MNHSNANKGKFILLFFISTFFLSACSQKNVKKTGSVEGSTIQDKNGGATSGTIGADGNPKATEYERNGGSNGVADGSSNFNYLPGNENAAKTGDGDISPAGLKDPNNLLYQRIIYFDYNDAQIRPEYMVLLNTHAQLLAKYPNLNIRLEGHADERGTREYNVALSEERAQSVKRLMGAQGARDFQMRTIGFGEEMPVVSGHSQDSWQKNRRVEIKYKNY